MVKDELTYSIIGCAMKVHRALGPGFLESVYQNALAHELRKGGVSFEVERPIQVRYDGHVVGDFLADFFLEGRLIVELKSVRALTEEREVQLVNYLTATGIEVGLLINFGAESLQYRRKYRTYRPTPAGW